MTEQRPSPPRSSPITFASADDSEELARAQVDGLLAQWWLAAPDAAWLTQFSVAVTQAPEAGTLLDAPWQDLVAAMRATTADAAEHGTLFHGVGKAEVFLYGSYHLTGFLNERPLALSRDGQRWETEDPVPYPFEMMRDLIAGDDIAMCNRVEQQRRFFRVHLQPWVDTLCDAVAPHPHAQTWRAVAGFTRALVQTETQAFDLLET